MGMELLVEHSWLWILSHLLASYSSGLCLLYTTLRIAIDFELLVKLLQTVNHADK